LSDACRYGNAAGLIALVRRYFVCSIRLVIFYVGRFGVGGMFGLFFSGSG